jgi:hypothetical protein
LSTRHHAAACENGVHAGASRSLASCLVSSGVRNFSLAGSPGYASLLGFSVQNLRFALPGVRKPDAVVLPASRRDLRRAVLCARRAAAAIRVRSGGHSYEGQSYTVAGAALGDGDAPFVVVDLMNLNRVRVDAASATAWAESGATLGEVYHAVARSASPNGSSSSSSLAFAAGRARRSAWAATSPAAGSACCRASSCSPPTTCWTRSSSTRRAVGNL